MIKSAASAASLRGGRASGRVDHGFFFATFREFANQLAASADSPDYVKFQAVIKSAARAASLRGGRASGRLDHVFLQLLAALAAKK